MHIAEPSVPEPRCFEAETTIGKLKRYKSPVTDKILVEVI
jgi:hypothetical protein